MALPADLVENGRCCPKADSNQPGGNMDHRKARWAIVLGLSLLAASAEADGTQGEILWDTYV